MKTDVKADLMDRITIETLGEALKGDNTLMHMSAMKYMQTIVWNRYFAGYQEAKDYITLKQQLDISSSDEEDPLKSPKESLICDRLIDVEIIKKNETRYCLADSFALCLKRAFELIGNQVEIASRLPVVINLFISNPRIHIHCESILALYQISFDAALSKTTADSSISQSKEMNESETGGAHLQSVDNYINALMSKCAYKQVGDSKKDGKNRNRLSSNDSVDYKLFQSLVPQTSKQETKTMNASYIHAEDTFESNRSSNDQDTTLLSTSEGFLRFSQSYMMNLIDQAEIYIEKEKVVADEIKTLKPRDPEGSLHTNEISIFTVPLTVAQQSPLYTRLFKLNLKNEKREICGKFGWCYMCRKTADFYCKDNRRPICSKDCKSNLINFLGIQRLISRKFSENK